uniref:Uncharacterized protein n=1 Tax=Brassica oleracea var. oleracea TaxID=109376 RepID=A0A0D3ALI6_BRAOL
MKALTVPNSLIFGEALLSKPANLEVPATGVQSKMDISTFRRTNPFEEGEYDVPQSIDQSKESDQHEVQDVLNILSEVHIFHHTGQTDRTVYWTVPHASGMELWLEPWPDDRFYRTRLCLPRPVLHFKINGQARFEFERVDFELVRATSFLASLDCTGRVLTLSLQTNAFFLLDRCVISDNRLSLPPCRTFLLPHGSSSYLALPIECSFLRAHHLCCEVFLFKDQRVPRRLNRPTDPQEYEDCNA